MNPIYEPNCGCCGNGELIEWLCPIEAREKEKAYKKKLDKIANVCLEGGFVSEEGRVVSLFGARYVIYPHGGKKKQKGRYVTISTKTGYLMYSKVRTNLVVVK